MDFGLSFFTSNPLLVGISAMDAVMVIILVRNLLHPILGRFDIALVLEPLGVKPENGKKKSKQQQQEEEPEIMMMAFRKELGPTKNTFQIGKGDDAETYTRDNAVVAFIQNTHRVFIYLKGKSYPVSVGFGRPARTTSAEGMDMFIARRLWEQGIRALKTATSLPVIMAIMCFAAGAGIAAMAFFIIHPGFVPQGTYPSSIVTQTINGITGSITAPLNTTSTTTTIIASSASTTIQVRP